MRRSFFDSWLFIHIRTRLKNIRYLHIMAKKYSNLLLFIVICLSVGWIGSIATGTSRETWYAALQKPPLNPPDWIFAPVWLTLYVFMAVAGWRIWGTEDPGRNRTRFLFVLQLCLNGIWSFLFFGLRSPVLGLMDIGLLWTSLFLLTLEAWRTERIAGFLLMPYLIWVSFATYLNASIWYLNR